MTAEEARKLAAKHCPFKYYVDKILLKVKKAATDGWHATNYYDNVNKLSEYELHGIKTRLNNLGYNVYLKQQLLIDESSYTYLQIEWRTNEPR